MLVEYLEQYVNNLYENQNRGAVLEQQGLYSKKDYYELLKPVVDLFNKDSFSLDEMREKLFNNSGIVESINDFIYKKEMVPGMVFSYGTNNYRETVVVGNKQEVTLDENDNIIWEY